MTTIAAVARAVTGDGGRVWLLGDHDALPVDPDARGDAVATVGTGREVALGSLDATLRRGVEPGDALREAVEAAMRYDPWSGFGVDVEAAG